MVPGGPEIALAPSKLMEKFQAVVWAQHGLFVSGSDFDFAFGLAHTIEKSAEIRCKILATGLPVLQTIPDDVLRRIAADYGLQINEEFLN